MACFVVPAAEAIVTSAVKKAAKKTVAENGAKHPFMKRLGWLNTMLWGGSALLAFEHVWHGEVTPFAPFLTAAANPASAAQMLREMAVSGTAMAALVSAVWVGMVMAANAVEKRNISQTSALIGETE